MTLPKSELDTVAKQIELADVDAVHFHIFKFDLWNAARKADLPAKLGFKMAATMNWSGTWHQHYDKDAAYVYRQHPDGSVAGRWGKKHLCFNAPVVREHLIPVRYQKQAGWLKPDQVWIDECVITVNLCWCEHCKRLYREQHNTDPPEELSEDNEQDWIQWTAFHRESFERWMVEVNQAIGTSAPDALVTFNHAWFVEQPESPPAYIKNLSADVHNDQLELGIYARYGGSGSLPFDLMPGLGSDYWAGVRPKKLETVLDDVAIITAHSGRWNIGEYPTTADAIGKRARDKGIKKRPAEQYVGLAKQGAAFARERQPFSQHTKPVASVTLLHSASTHYDHVIRLFNSQAKSQRLGKTSDGDFKENKTDQPNSRIYWPGNHPMDRSLVGAYQAMLETHVHFNFTIEDRLEEDLQQSALLVLAEQHRLSPESIEAIRSYVHGGGKVLATGTTRHAGLDDLFDYKSAKPTRMGKGLTLYLKENLFLKHTQASGYSRKPKGDADMIRSEVAEAIESLLPDPAYSFDAPPWIEWTLRSSEDGKDLLVHLINRKASWVYRKNATPKAWRCEITLAAAPDSVTLELGGQAIPWQFENGRLKVVLDETAQGRHRILHVKKAFQDR